MKKKSKAIVIAAVVVVLIALTSICVIIRQSYKKASVELFDCIRSNDIEGVDEIITKYPKLINKYRETNIVKAYASGDSNTPLGQACLEFNKELIYLLINKGANINQKCSNIIDEYALHLMISNYYEYEYVADFETWKELMWFLIDNGADLTVEGWRGNFIYSITSCRAADDEAEKQQAILEFLKYGVDKKLSFEPPSFVPYDMKTLLGAAASSNQALCCEYLLNEKLSEVNEIVDEIGSTALISAAKHSEGISAIKVLLNHGADRTIKDNNGKTAYDYAVENGNTELAELLKF